MIQVSKMNRPFIAFIVELIRRCIYDTTFDLWDEQAIKLSSVGRSIHQGYWSLLQKLPQVACSYSVSIPLVCCIGTLAMVGLAG